LREIIAKSAPGLMTAPVIPKTGKRVHDSPRARPAEGVEAILSFMRCDFFQHLAPPVAIRTSPRSRSRGDVRRAGCFENRSLLT
jgi:hypothetical protein